MYEIFHAHTNSSRRVNWNHCGNNIFDFWQIITETFSCVIHRPISLQSTQSPHLVEMVFAESALVYDEHLFISLRLISLNSHSNCFRKWNLNMSHSCRVCVCEMDDTDLLHPGQHYVFIYLIRFYRPLVQAWWLHALHWTVFIEKLANSRLYHCVVAKVMSLKYVPISNDTVVDEPRRIACKMFAFAAKKTIYF